MLFATVIYLAIQDTWLHGMAPEIFLRLYRSAVVVAFFDTLYAMCQNDANHFASLAERLKINLDPILANILSSALRTIIFVFAFLVLAKEWGYDVSGLVAGLGLGGLALAMASKDSLANIFGGLLILADKPFAIGDWIQTSSIEGTVEEVTFRCTKIRTIEQALVHIPNSNLTNVAIVNFSRRKKRRASFTLGLTYAAKRKEVEACVAAIKKLLSESDELAQEAGDCFVAFEEYADSSLNIRIIFHTLAVDYIGHSRSREKINLAIFDVVESLGLSIAFPSRSLYLETPLKVEKAI
jgi:MscS family membrane protein